MPKEEYELFGHECVPWGPVGAGSGAAAEGMVEKILNLDHSTGVGTRLLKFPPGVETSAVIVHDFWEEVYVLEGELHDKRLNAAFTTGMYACRPPGMQHGPYSSPIGCMTLDVLYYNK